VVGSVVFGPAARPVAQRRLSGQQLAAFLRQQRREARKAEKGY